MHNRGQKPRPGTQPEFIFTPTPKNPALASAQAVKARWQLCHTGGSCLSLQCHRRGAELGDTELQEARPSCDSRRAGAGLVPHSQLTTAPWAPAKLVTSTASSARGQKEKSSSKYILFILTLNASSVSNMNPQRSEAGTHLNYIINLRFIARDE